LVVGGYAVSPHAATSPSACIRVHLRLKLLPYLLQSAASVRLPHEDERSAGDDWRAGADERHVRVHHLARAGATRCLQRTFNDVPQTVDASRAEAPSERVQRQLAVEFDPPVLDEVERLALLAEAVDSSP
jgi:hypothetical protein